jgi:hypothetical protein
MIPCNCVVQEGQIPDDTAAALRASISAFTERTFGAPAEFRWLTVPKRSGFTASAPSTSSVISLRAPRAVSPMEREPLLRELCGVWTEHTKCSLNELVGVISDPVAD